MLDTWDYAGRLHGRHKWFVRSRKCFYMVDVRIHEVQIMLYMVDTQDSCEVHIRISEVSHVAYGS